MPLTQTQTTDQQHKRIKLAAAIENKTIRDFIANGADDYAKRVIAADKERRKEVRERRS